MILLLLKTPPVEVKNVIVIYTVSSINRKDKQ